MASSSVHASVLQALSTYTTALGGTYTHAIAAVAGALGVPGERGVLAAAALVMSANAVVTFIALLAFIPAPYGKFAVSGGARWGPGVPARVAWLLQEAPSFACAALGWYAAAVAAAGARRAAVTINPSTALLAAFLGHYAYRSFVYPLRIRGGKATPLGIFLLAAAFTTYNGWMQGRYLAAFAPVGGKASAALLAPRFVFGAVLWATGLAVNLHSDHILRTLRKPGETGYQIPRVRGRDGGEEAGVGGGRFALLPSLAPFAPLSPAPLSLSCHPCRAARLSSCRLPTTGARSSSGAALRWLRTLPFRLVSLPARGWGPSLPLLASASCFTRASPLRSSLLRTSVRAACSSTRGTRPSFLTTRATAARSSRTCGRNG